jgi:hypothetical protein
MFSLRTTTRTRGSIILGWNLFDPHLCSAGWRLQRAMNGPAPSVHMEPLPTPHTAARAADPVFDYLQLDMAAMAAILESQGPAPAAAPLRC